MNNQVRRARGSGSRWFKILFESPKILHCYFIVIALVFIYSRYHVTNCTGSSVVFIKKKVFRLGATLFHFGHNSISKTVVRLLETSKVGT